MRVRAFVLSKCRCIIDASAFFIREGRGMNKIAKDMSKVYAGTSTAALIKNRHGKAVAFYRLNAEDGYWAKKERARIMYMLKQIDAELEARALQIPLF